MTRQVVWCNNLINEVRPAGHHSESFQAKEGMASGMYMYRLVQRRRRTLSGTVMLLK